MDVISKLCVVYGGGDALGLALSTFPDAIYKFHNINHIIVDKKKVPVTRNLGKDSTLSNSATLTNDLKSCLLALPRLVVLHATLNHLS